MIKYEKDTIIIPSTTSAGELYAFERDLNEFLSGISGEMEDLGWSFEAEFVIDIFGIILKIRFVHDETGEMGEIRYSADIDSSAAVYRLKRETSDSEFIPEWAVIEDRICDVLKIFFDEIE